MRRVATPVLIAIIVFSSLAFPEAALAKEGKLQKFEKELDKKEEPSQQYRDPGQVDYDDRSSMSATEVTAAAAMSSLYSFFLMGLASGGATTSSQLYTQLKESGSAALPTLKVDAAYHFLVDNIHGFVGKAEGGYLMFGADAEYINYFEKNAPDLSFVSGHFLLRTLFARFIGINLALGAKSIWGADKHTGFEFGFPFYLYIKNWLIFDVQPYIAWVHGNRVIDMAAGVSFKYRPVGLRIAYRGIQTGNQTLHGPQVGLFIQW